MAVLAERGRIALPMVEVEIATHCAQWQAADADGDAALLKALLPGVALDEFDSVNLSVAGCRLTITPVGTGIGNIPPAEAEANFYAALETEPMAA